MNLHRKMCIYLSIIFVLSIIIFCMTKSAHPTLSNILIAIITGTFISIYTSLVNYLHLKEEFFNNFFFNGAIINSNYERIKQLILNLNETSNLKYAINALKGYSNTIETIILGINFDLYSPFASKSEEKQLIDKINGIYVVTNKAVIMAIRQIEISYMNIELNKLKLVNLLHPCSYCNIPNEQRLPQEQCSKFIEYQSNIIAINNKIEILNKYIKETIKVLLENTQNLQSEYIDIMKDIHSKTKNKTRWVETIEADKQNIQKTINEYVKNSINSNK